MATNFEKVADHSGSNVPLARATTILGAKLAPSLMTIEDLLSETRQYLTLQDMENIRHAYNLAGQAHNGAVRKSGEPYIQHPLEVALLLAKMRIDADGIVSALLHDVVEDTDFSLDDLSEQFGAAVANIVDGVTKFDALAGKPGVVAKHELLPEKARQESAAEINKQEQTTPPPPSLVDKRRQRSETVRKMLLAMAEDPRVVVLKLADRLHNMRTLGAMSHAQQQIKARETSEIYAPLARRLGMYLVQADLEDLAFAYLEPEKYQRLALQIDEEVKKRQPFVDEVCRILREEMEHAQIKGEVIAWRKHLASINRKLEENVNDVTQLHDLISFRILVESDYECYLSLGHIHGLWRPKDGRIKDFIATPKLNGYQSLHTTVFCLQNRLAEIQIRTYEMQRTADYGIASYWYLKDRIGHDEHNVTHDDDSGPRSWRLSYREMAGWIEQLREWQHSLPTKDADEFVEAVKDDLFQEQIFVFTPKGDVKDLPRGSTPLDMAYRIHTDIGDHCAGARIITNMDDSGRLVTRLVPLDYELKGGEIVDIMVNRTVHPTRDWISFARTAAARNKIRRYLKTYEREIDLQLGRERLDFALKTVGAAGLNDHAENLLRTLRVNRPTLGNGQKKYTMLDDMYIALGRGSMRVEEVLNPLLPLLPESVQARNQANLTEQTDESTISPQHSGELANLVTLAGCCCPIPGDAIVGCLMPGEGMVVHRCTCKALCRQEDITPIEVNWLQIKPELYPVLISIIAHDRAGLLRDVAAVVADASINMTAVASTTNASSQKAEITATLEIASDAGVLEQMERVMRRLRQVKSVVNVERAEGK